MLAISNAKLPITVVGIYTEFSEQTCPFKQTVQIRRKIGLGKMPFISKLWKKITKNSA